MDFNSAWLRKDTVGTASVYYGYAVSVASADSDRVWSIRKISTTSNSSVIDSVTWSDNEILSYNGKWSERVANFTAPSGSLGVTFSKATDTFSNVTINTSWTILSGVNTYKVTVIDQNGVLYGPVKTPINQVFLNNYGGERITDKLIGINSYPFIGTTGMTYSITVTGVNTIGTTASTVTVTT